MVVASSSLLSFATPQGGSVTRGAPSSNIRRCCLSSRFSFGGRVRRKLRAHVLPDDDLLTPPVPLDSSAPDSTVAVHAESVVALSVERYLDELRLWHQLHPSFLVGYGRR